MTLILKVDPEMIKIHNPTKSCDPRFDGSAVRVQKVPLVGVLINKEREKHPNKHGALALLGVLVFFLAGFFLTVSSFQTSNGCSIKLRIFNTKNLFDSDTGPPSNSNEVFYR